LVSPQPAAHREEILREWDAIVAMLAGRLSVADRAKMTTKKNKCSLLFSSFFADPGFLKITILFSGAFGGKEGERKGSVQVILYKNSLLVC
jgi:hypothetical protein